LKPGLPLYSCGMGSTWANFDFLGLSSKEKMVAAGKAVSTSIPSIPERPAWVGPYLSLYSVVLWFLPASHNFLYSICVYQEGNSLSALLIYLVFLIARSALIRRRSIVTLSSVRG